MKSHEYEFAAVQALTLIGSAMIPAGLFAAAMNLGAAANLWPCPRPTLDMDRTILLHQAETSRSKHGADLLVIGDSSCLMDVSAPKLSAALPGRHRALNLGTLSYVDLSVYASLLRHYAAGNPDRLRTVVLLMHPEALRRPAPEQHHVELLDRYLAGKDYCEPSGSPVLCWMGAPIFKGRLLSRVVPAPLEGPYALKCGFTADLWEYLSNHDGSAIDSRRFDRATAQGNAEYHLSARLEAASAAFRSAVPGNVKLVVGITPAPESFVVSDYDRRYGEMLRQWSAWLRADAELAELPPTLPDNLFASTTHVNEKGQQIYTDLLAQSLARHVAQQ